MIIRPDLVEAEKMTYFFFSGIDYLMSNDTQIFG